MKKAILILSLVLALCPVFGAVHAEASGLESSLNNFLSSLDQTAGALGDLASEAGSAAAEWAEGAAEDAQRFIDENLPELTQALKNALDSLSGSLGEELSSALDTLREEAGELGKHSKEELDKAYETLKRWMDDSEVDEDVRQAVEDIANAAGVGASKQEPADQDPQN